MKFCLKQSTPRRTIAMLVLMMILPTSRAALLFYESFDYPADQKLGELSSSNTWENPKNQFVIAAGSLNFPGLESARGNRVAAEPGSANLDSVRTVNRAWAEQSSGALYVSFLLRLESVAEIGTTGEGTSLLTITHTSNKSQLLGVNLLNDGAVRLGVLKYPSDIAPVSASAFFKSGPGANLSAGGTTTYFIVAKYEWIAGASNDVVTLWVNPATFGAEEDAGNRISVSGGIDGGKSAGRLILTRGAHVSIDEIRIGQKWSEVAPAGEAQRRSILPIVILACGLVIAGFWIAQLRGKVKERSAALRAQIRERQKAEQLQLVEQERARIAHDLHDELGADITEVSMLATRALVDNGDSTEQRRCLEQMADKTRQMVATLEEIVWAMNPRHDSLRALMSYFSFFADRFLGLANIKLTLETSEAAADLAVEARVRHQLFLAFKEALANVVKHSGASEVRLIVCVENQTLRVIVEDNGQGLGAPETNAGGHDGIANMRRRMEKLGGQFQIAGETGRGTTVQFIVPLNS